MKFDCLFIMIVCISYQANTQDYEILPEILKVTFTDNMESKNVGYSVRNNTSETLNWAWTLELDKDFPEEWTFKYVADQRLAGWPFFELPDNGILNQLIPGDSTNSILTYIRVSNNGVPGSTSFKFCIYDTLDYSVDALTCTSFLTSTEEFIKNDINLYPNPTCHNFQISDHSDIESLAIHSISGQMVTKYQYEKGKKYNIDHLDVGFYLVSATDKYGQLIRTFKLKKE